jgi:hypothetical protein
LALEDKENPRGWAEIDLEGVSNELVSYQIKILSQGGLIEADNCSTQSGFDWRAVGLTWAGHEFLDTIKNDTVWAKTKSFVLSKGGSASFTVIGKIASAFAEKHHLLDKLL